MPVQNQRPPSEPEIIHRESESADIVNSEEDVTYDVNIRGN